MKLFIGYKYFLLLLFLGMIGAEQCSAASISGRLTNNSGAGISGVTATAYGATTVSGYSTVSVTGNHVYSDNIGDEYVLFPVWMLNYRFRGKDHNFMLNGQTGKIVADRPISWKRAGMWFGIIFLIVFLITEIGGLFI